MQYIHRNDLIGNEQLAALCERSDWRAGAHLLVHLLMIALTGVLVHMTLWSAWTPVAMLLHGTVLNWLYAAQHEMMHYTAFRTRAFNEWGSRLTGLIVLFPRELDRIAHFRHHRHTNDPARDPELSDVGPDAQPPGVLSLAWRLIGVRYWIRRLRYLLMLTLGNTALVAFMNDTEQRVVVREARWHVFVYTLIAVLSWLAGSWAALIYWLGPLVLARGTHEVQNIVEHTGRPLVSDVLSNTRVIRCNALLRRLGWNMQYHCHHHLFAAVPFYRLPELDRLIGDRLPQPVSYAQALGDVLRGAPASAPHGAQGSPCADPQGRGA